MGELFDLAVAGAGASGLMAAITAAQAGARALVLEAGEKPCRKLLATGNGRCNLTNENISPAHYHGDRGELAGFLADWPGSRVRSLFDSLGLLTRADPEGRVYPYSLQAAAVAGVLRSACAQAGVTIRCGFPVAGAAKSGGVFRLSGPGGQVRARACVLACGGAASPQLSGGSGYDLARQLGHRVTPLAPALVGLRAPAKLTRPLKGMRCKARASLFAGERPLYTENGEVIFGDGSVSGICVMNASARLTGPGPFRLTLDLAPDLPTSRLKEHLKAQRRLYPQAPAGELFAGVLNLRVGQELAKSLGLTKARTLGSLAPRELDRAAEAVKAFPLPVSGPLGWEHAQCSAGGVPLCQVDGGTMESRKVPGLYITGELLNVHGDCGGYNLHLAWSTGAAAGASAAKSLGKR